MMMMACCMPMMMMAQSVQYCMTYGEEYKIKTGDKEADKKLKKEVLAIKAGKQIYVNCRNLRDDDVVLECSNYVQGYPYDGNKLIIAAYHISNGAFLLGFGSDIASMFTPLGTSVALKGVSAAVWLGRNQLNSFRCYVVDTDANEKGRYPVTRINDEYMEKLLANDAHLLARYKAVSNKKERQSASNVLAIMTEKGLVPSE